MPFGEMMMLNARIIPIKRGREAKSITKNPDGSMLVVQGSGDSFTNPADDRDLQAFVVYTMLNDQCTEAD